jgi:hypothetical protein
MKGRAINYDFLVPGKKFSRLTFLRRIDSLKSEWVCDCGNLHICKNYCVVFGYSKSCGCLKQEMIASGRAHYIHGHGSKNDPTHRVWLEMKRRCSNPKRNSYERYGARGITVCERWKSFVNFLEDMGERPQGKSLDRINNNGNYEPGNCKWSTATEQANNRRKRRWYKKPCSKSEVFDVPKTAVSAFDS